MEQKFIKTIKDIHRATGIPENGQGQRLIRDPIRENNKYKEGRDWIKTDKYYLTEEACQELIEELNLHSQLFHHTR